MVNMVVNYPNFLNLKRHIEVCTPKDIYNEELTEDQQVEDGIIEEKPSNEEIIKTMKYQSKLYS